MGQNSLAHAQKRPEAAVRGMVILSLLLLTTSCPRPERGTGPAPLEGFYAKVTALVTTSVRSHLRGNQDRQALLRASLPSLEGQPTMAQLMKALKSSEALSGLSRAIEADVNFELGKPEHQEVKSSFDTPDVQKSVVAAIIQGMRRALGQR